MAQGMAQVVVDASVAAAWFLPDEATPFTEATLQACTAGDVWVPALWQLEIGNLFVSAQRRKRITAEKRSELASVAARLRLRVDREPLNMVELDALAAGHALTTYHAVYLELALRRGLPLATLDAALSKAASRAGVAAYAPPS